MSQRWSLWMVAVAISVSGCGEAPTTPKTPVTTPSATASAGGEKATKTFTVEEQAQIDKQKTCPVGGESLGGMGTPYKMMVGDRAVYLCCEHCKDAVLKDPEKYLAILDAAAKSPAEATPAATTEAGTPVAETPVAPAKP